MKVIGITGPTGSGKTTALLVLQKLGARIIDCDALYHELLNGCAEMKAEITARFPDARTDGGLDRKKLGAIVFADSVLLAELSAIAHKYVTESVLQIIAEEKEKNGKAVAIDAIALIESGIAGLCDIVAAVVADEEVRVKRIMGRENITEEYARLRIGAQKKAEWYAENCALALYNNGTEAEFIKKCTEEFGKII